MFRYFIICAAMLMSALHVHAAQEPNDTVYFYNSWAQVLDMSPEAMIENPDIIAYTPYDIDILTPDEAINEMMLKNHVAATLGDSIWLISSEYIKENFDGDVRRLEGFLPMFFNDRVAYFMSAGNGVGSISVLDVLFGSGASEYKPNYYYIDFVGRKVIKITPAALSSLLEDYHDLQMRYEGMKDYKKAEIVEDYFYKFIDRATTDVMRPYILDAVAGWNDDN